MHTLKLISLSRCFLYRQWALWLVDNSGTLPAPLQKHLNSCASCHAAVAVQVTLIQNLRQQSVGELPSPELSPHVKIFARIHHRERINAKSWQSRPNWGWGSVLAATTAVLAGIIFLHFKSSTERAQSSAAEQLTPAVQQALRFMTFEQEKVLSWNEQLNAPLQQELDYVVADAKAALKLLADNYLPPKQDEP